MYSRRHFSWLPQAVSKRLINSLSYTVSYASMIIGPFISGFAPNEVRNNFQICDNSMITLGKRGFCLVFSEISRVDSLDRFRGVVVEKVHNYIDNLKKKHFSRR